MPRVDASITEADFLSALRLNARLDGDHLAFAIIGTLIALGTGIALVAQRGAPLLRVTGTTLICAVIGAWVGATVTRSILLPMRARRTYRQLKALRSPITVAWDDNGIRWESDYESVRLPWADIVRSREDDASMLIYVTDKVFRFIPKRNLTDRDTLNDLRQRLRKTAAAA